MFEICLTKHSCSNSNYLYGWYTKKVNANQQLKIKKYKHTFKTWHTTNFKPKQYRFFLWIKTWQTLGIKAKKTLFIDVSEQSFIDVLEQFLHWHFRANPSSAQIFHEFARNFSFYCRHFPDFPSCGSDFPSCCCVCCCYYCCCWTDSPVCCYCCCSAAPPSRLPPGVWDVVKVFLVMSETAEISSLLL